MNIPKAKFHIGDEVNVCCEEAGQPPTFRAYILGITYSKCGELYTIIEEGERISDGYTEDWLTLVNNKEFAAEIILKELVQWDNNWPKDKECNDEERMRADIELQNIIEKAKQEYK